MPNWFAACQHPEAHPDKTKAILKQGTISSPKTSDPTQEGPILSAAAVANGPQVEWAEGQLNGPNLAIQSEGGKCTSGDNWERAGLRSRAADDVVMTTAQVATKEEVLTEDIVASQEAAS